MPIKFKWRCNYALAPGYTLRIERISPTEIWVDAIYSERDKSNCPMLDLYGPKEELDEVGYQMLEDLVRCRYGNGI